MRIGLSALCVLLISVAVSAQSVPELAEGKVTGAGFVLTLPPNVTAEVAGTPETLHGFQINLAPRGSVLQAKSNQVETYRYIAFDTRWDIGDMPSLEAVVQEITSHILKYVPEELMGSGDLILSASLPARLGTLPARRLVMNYRNSEKQPAIRQMIVAYNARHDASALIYLLILNTTQQSFREDLGVFSKVLAGFKLTGQ
jgi:hypothetical protein